MIRQCSKLRTYTEVSITQCTHTYTRTHKCTHTCTHTCMHMHIHTCMHTYSYACTGEHACTNPSHTAIVLAYLKCIQQHLHTHTQQQTLNGVCTVVTLLATTCFNWQSQYTVVSMSSVCSRMIKRCSNCVFGSDISYLLHTLHSSHACIEDHIQYTVR